PLGRVGIAVCLDAFQEDVLAALQHQGAQILVQPSANPAPWSPEQQVDWLNGAWRAVAGTGRFTYGVNPMMVGPLYELTFAGQSAIVGRSDSETGGGSAVPPGGSGPAQEVAYHAVGPRPGFLAVAASPSDEEVLVVRVPHPDRRGDWAS
ncbi:MAG: hypothetical protein IRY95_10575, partial [Clostridia bacterium]|nr:hypothetical protein [Clostridia bacterium]